MFGVLGLAARQQVGQMLVQLRDGRLVAYEVKGWTSAQLAGALSSLGYTELQVG